ERGRDRDPIEDDEDEPAAAAPLRRASQSLPQARERARVTAPVLSLGDSDVTSRAPVERRMGGFTPPPLSLLDAPKAERKLDERELMEGARLVGEEWHEFAVEGRARQND